MSDLTRVELEAIIMENRNQIKNLQQKCKYFENYMDKWKQKSKIVQKMHQDLNTVVKRYINGIETQGYVFEI